MNVLKSLKFSSDTLIGRNTNYSKINVLLRTLCLGLDEKKEPIFFNSEVQQLLKRLIKVDHNVIFQPRKLGKKLKTPELKFMTDEELEDARKKVDKKIKQALQMPPVLPPQEEINHILDKDPKLIGYSKSKYVFTDISYGKTDRDRLIIVRDVDGTLRKGTLEERNRSNEIYFPVEGRKLRIPQMFQSGYFEKVLEKGWFKFILERACIQFEPDDPLYVSVTRATYNKISETQSFQQLESTRHFGSMVFYLAQEENLAQLLIYYLTYGRLDDILMVIRLHDILHPDKKCSISSSEGNELAVLKTFVAERYPKYPDLELAVKSYEDFVSHPKSEAAV